MTQRVANLEAQLATLTHTVSQLVTMVTADHKQLIQDIKSVVQTPPTPVATSVSIEPVVHKSLATSINNVQWCYASYQPHTAVAGGESFSVVQSHQMGMGRDDHRIQALQDGMYVIRVEGLLKHTGVSGLAEVVLTVDEKPVETIAVPLLGPVGSSYGYVSATIVRHLRTDGKVALINGNTAVTTERLTIMVNKC